MQSRESSACLSHLTFSRKWAFLHSIDLNGVHKSMTSSLDQACWRQSNSSEAGAEFLFYGWMMEKDLVSANALDYKAHQPQTTRQVVWIVGVIIQNIKRMLGCLASKLAEFPNLSVSLDRPRKWNLIDWCGLYFWVNAFKCTFRLHKSNKLISEKTTRKSLGFISVPCNPVEDQCSKLLKLWLTLFVPFSKGI